MTDSLDVHVVPHTHWDREWYHPAGRFRQRLVSLVDELLDRDVAAGPRSFLLDGQAVVLDDYLAVRPDRRDALAAQLRSGALEAGPWYVLADELIPSGEALVRNLLAGRRTLAGLDAEPPPVLYSPDAFGHAAALPALASGFGLALAIAWRGLGGARWPTGDTFRWRAADGSSVVLHHLPPDGYELGSNLPTSPADAADRWAHMRAVLADRSRLGVLLVHNGADHHALQADWPRAFTELARAAGQDRVRCASLAEFAAAVVARAAAAELPAIAGELRDSYGYAWTLQGTFATRAAQKRRNAIVERTLVRDTEPWLALARLGGHDDAGRAALLHSAWKTLLLCHPHDTLCGCSTDEVERAMEARLDDAAAQADGLRHAALLGLLGHEEADVRTRADEWRPVVAVRNAAARARGGVAEVELLLSVAPAPVGPGSAGDTRAVRAVPGTGGRLQSIGGGSVAIQPLDRALVYDRVESPRHYPRNDVVERVRAVAWVPPIGAYSLRTFALDAPGSAGDACDGPTSTVTVRDNRMHNGVLDVSVGTDGRVRLATADGAFDVPSAIGFEDVGDAGDLYTHSAIGTPLTAAWFAGARTVHRGPLRGEIEARWRLRIPAKARPPETPLARPLARGGRHVELDLVVTLTLDAGAPFLRVRVSGDNLARDHRLRVVFRTGIIGAEVHADAAFGPVLRAPLEVPAEEQAAERVVRTAPLHRYVSLTNAVHGLTIFSDGLAEYEATDGADVAVTLVRAVGELSRPDLPERPGHAGWPVSTPAAQSVGAFAAAFALMPHGPRSPRVAASVEQAADDVLLPLCGETMRSAIAPAETCGGAELVGQGLAVTCIKPAEMSGWVVLRCVNLTSDHVEGAWVLGAPVREAQLARLDETPLAPLTPDAGTVRFTALPHAIVTVLAR